MTIPKRVMRVAPDLRIRKGLKAVCEGRAVRVVGVHSGGQIHLKVKGTSDFIWADASMIEPFRPDAPQKSIRAPNDCDIEKEKSAVRWHEVLVNLTKASPYVVRAADCREVALRMGVHPRTVRRRLSAYLGNPIPASQLPATPGPSPGSRRLEPIVESLIAKAIEEIHLTRERGYDPQGNMENKNGQAYRFDYGNRLRQVDGKGNYLYDGHGRRARDVVNGVAKHSQYLANGQLAFTAGSRAMEVKEYIYLGDDLVAIRERDANTNLFTFRYQHNDALGSALVETDANRNILTRTEYEPYGLTNRPTNDGPGYTGHVQDAATGLTYMQQRYYDPQIGRFLSVDPVTAYSMPGSNFNRYWYANNNPYRFTDPDGRYSCTGDGCDRIDATVTAMRAALGQMTRGTSDFNRMQRIVNAIGEKGEAGPQYQTGALEGEAAASYSQDTHITKVDLSKTDSTAYLAMNLGHEVTHEMDQASRKGEPTKTVGEVRQTETNAYRNGAVVAKALGVKIPANEVRRGIEASVKRWESRQKKEE